MSIFDVIGNFLCFLDPVSNDGEIGLNTCNIVLAVDADENVEESFGRGLSECFEIADIGEDEQGGGFGADADDLHELEFMGDELDICGVEVILFCKGGAIGLLEQESEELFGCFDFIFCEYIDGFGWNDIDIGEVVVTGISRGSGEEHGKKSGDKNAFHRVFS